MAENTGFSMQILNASAIEQELVAAEQVVPEEIKKIREQAQINAVAILNCDLDSLEARQQFTTSIDQFGVDVMQKCAAKNSLLTVRVGKLMESGTEGGMVAKGLTDLNREMKGLDPSAVDFTKTGVLGKLFNPVRAYFEKFERTDSVIESILSSLDQGKSKLKDDNTTLAIEQAALRDLSKKLKNDIEMATTMDDVIVAKLEEAQAQNVDEDKIRFVQEEILFPLRQRIMDMQQLIVVNHQGIIAMEVVQRNNKELMRGVDRAKMVTVTALRTAVMVAGALYNQKIVLKKIQMLNETTNNLIASTSRMLKEQGTEIHKQSVEANISVDVLKTAFYDVITALDDISSFKRQALPLLKQNIDQFRELAEVGEQHIQRLEKGSTMSEANG